MSNKLRIAAIALAALPVLALTGCATTTNGAAATAADATSSQHAPVTDAASLFAFMKSGVGSLTSIHIGMNITAAGEKITAAGNETLASGKLTAMDLTETVPGFGSMRVLVVGGMTYVQLPAKYNTTGKPWQLVSTNSSNPVIQQMAQSLASIQSSASLDQFTTYAGAAQSVTPKGTEQIDGADATHYAVVVDIAKLPDSLPGKQTLIQAGVTTLPMQLWLDGQGRPVKITEDLAVEGSSVSSVITMSDYNAPVTITAPPADQVSTS